VETRSFYNLQTKYFCQEQFFTSLKFPYNENNVTKCVMSQTTFVVCKLWWHIKYSIHIPMLLEKIYKCSKVMVWRTAHQHRNRWESKKVLQILPLFHFWNKRYIKTT